MNNQFKLTRDPKGIQPHLLIKAVHDWKSFTYDTFLLNISWNVMHVMFVQTLETLCNWNSSEVTLF